MTSDYEFDTYNSDLDLVLRFLIGGYFLQLFYLRLSLQWALHSNVYYIFPFFLYSTYRYNKPKPKPSNLLEFSWYYLCIVSGYNWLTQGKTLEQKENDYESDEINHGYKEQQTRIQTSTYSSVIRNMGTETWVIFLSQHEQCSNQPVTRSIIYHQVRPCQYWHLNKIKIKSTIFIVKISKDKHKKYIKSILHWH